MDLLKEYALRFIGIPYKFGGRSPMEGLDCSQLMQEILASVGLDPPGDQTAQTLFDYFSIPGNSAHLFGPKLGALLFFGESVTKITHVAMALDEFRMVEAGGGRSSTRTLEDAIEDNAYVKIAYIAKRKDLVAVLRPRYEKIGVIK